MNTRKGDSSIARQTSQNDECRSRRKSWFQSTPFHTLFSASSNRQSRRSQSLDESAGMLPASKKQSGFTSVITKACLGRRRKLVTPGLRRVSEDTTRDNTNHTEEQWDHNPSAGRSAPVVSNLMVATIEDEADRLRRKNDLVKLAFKDEFILPLNLQQLEDGRVLDIGCGPGSWCIDIAQEYPQIQVIGVDAVAMFPDKNFTPPNCQLMQHNVLHGLHQFPPNHFDYIHIRFTNMSFTVDQYRTVIQDCWRILKPGRGFLALMEMDAMIYSPGPVTEKLNQEVLEMARSRGLNPRLARQLMNLLPSDAVQPTEGYRSLPIGLWGGRLGVLFRDDLLQVLTQTRAAVNQHLGRTEPEQEEFESELAACSRELKSYHSYCNFYFVTAQKPNTETCSQCDQASGIKR